MHAKYADEVSNFKISTVFSEFLGKNLKNFGKRIFYNYYLRDMSLASFELPLGLLLLPFGLVYGIVSWASSSQHGVVASSGTVMLAAMPVILGVQLILAFIGSDISSTPKRSIHDQLGRSALNKSGNL